MAASTGGRHPHRPPRASHHTVHYRDRGRGLWRAQRMWWISRRAKRVLWGYPIYIKSGLIDQPFRGSDLVSSVMCLGCRCSGKRREDGTKTQCDEKKSSGSKPIIDFEKTRKTHESKSLKSQRNGKFCRRTTDLFDFSGTLRRVGERSLQAGRFTHLSVLAFSAFLSLPPLKGRYNFDQGSAPMARPGNKIIQAKLVLLGDMGTGKTSLVLRFVKGQFFDNQEPTIGAAFFTQILSLSEATVKFDIWDTAGQERYHSLAPMYYRGAASAVVVYDISSTETFTRAKKWVQELQRQGNLNLVMALVANKCDLEAKREVESEEGEQFAQENGMFFLETSAKTAQNINELFHEIAKRLARAAPAKPARANLNSETRDRRRMGFCCLG